MDATFIFRGILLGFSVAAPVGPIGVLCIRRTLADGRATGLVSGLGAATADLVYGAISAFGLTAISDLLVGQAFWFRLVGGLFLIYLGIRTGFSAPTAAPAEAGPLGSGALGRAYFSTFLLTLTNPMTILSFAAVFAGVGLGAVSKGAASQGPLEAGLLVAGVFTGSAAWWLLLSTGVGILRQKITPAVLGLGQPGGRGDSGCLWADCAGERGGRQIVILRLEIRITSQQWNERSKYYTVSVN